MNYFVIGDIHGEINKLEVLITKIEEEIQSMDLGQFKIVFLGDYINKGSQSLKVIDFLIALKEKLNENVVFLKGNHEQLLIKAFSGEIDSKLDRAFLKMHFKEFKNEKRDIEVSNRHKQFFLNLNDYYIDERLLFVHGGISKIGDISIFEYGVLADLPPEVDLVIRGHEVHKEVTFYKNNIAVDTGAYIKDQPLSCLTLPSQRVITSF